jgi:hypothetical protein
MSILHESPFRGGRFRDAAELLFLRSPGIGRSDTSRPQEIATGFSPIASAAALWCLSKVYISPKL